MNERTNGGSTIFGKYTPSPGKDFSQTSVRLLGWPVVVRALDQKPYGEESQGWPQ